MADSRTDKDGYLIWTQLHDGPDGEYQQQARVVLYDAEHPHNPLTVTGVDMTPDASMAYRDESFSLYHEYSADQIEL